MKFSAENWLTEIGANVASTVGTTLGGLASYNVFIGKIPDMPREAIGVIPTGGYAPQGNDPLKAPGTQIIVRTASYRTGLNTAERIYKALDKKAATLSTYKTIVYPQALFTGSYYLDERSLYNFSMNFIWKVIWVD